MKDNFDLNNEDKNNNKLEDKPIKKQNPSKKASRREAFFI